MINNSKYFTGSKFNFNIDQLDIEDNEEEFSLSKQQCKPKSMKQEYIENQFVDLGLPSGTKWCKYNLGCDFTKLQSDPENTTYIDWYGNYYAWGEIKPKKIYNFENYKFSEENCDAFSKYCTEQEYSANRYVDDLTVLQLEDDAAYQYNSNWKIPTKEQFDELLKNTKHTIIYSHYAKGCNGFILESNINNEMIFFPFSGFYSADTWNVAGNAGYYWTSNLSSMSDDESYIVVFHRGFKIAKLMKAYRTLGMNIRPVLTN